jgi:hypothetical protein
MRVDLRIWPVACLLKPRDKVHEMNLMIVQEPELNGTMKSLVFPYVSAVAFVHPAGRRGCLNGLVEYGNTLAAYLSP